MENPKNVSLDSSPYTTYLDHTLFVPFFQEAQKGYVGALPHRGCRDYTVATVRPSRGPQQPTVEKSRGCRMPPLRLGKVVAELNPQQLQTQPTNCEMWKTPENSRSQAPPK